MSTRKSIIFQIKLPAIVNVSKNRRFSLNLNQYRNAHYQTLSKAKRVFHQEVFNELRFVKKIQHPVGIHYSVIAGSKRKFDISNICTVVDKFFCDAMVKENLIDDDDYRYIAELLYSYGGYEKGNQHVLAQVYEL